MTASSRAKLSLMAITLLAIGLVCGSVAAPPSIESISAESYWYFKARGLILSESANNDAVLGNYRSRHGAASFHLDRSDVDDLGAKKAGYIRALEDLASIAAYASSEQVRDEAQDTLVQMLGINISNEAWGSWLATNSDRLVWNEKGNNLVIKSTLESGEKQRP